MAVPILTIFKLLLVIGSITGAPTQMKPTAMRDETLPTLQYPGHLDKDVFFSSKHGTYFFQYDTGNSGPSSFRGESRDWRGVITGYYGYIDPEGVLRITHYKADEKGFKASTVLRYLTVNASIS